MNCGQSLPDGVKFCYSCGTSLAELSSVTADSKKTKLDEEKAFVPAMCPNCNAHMKVDSSLLFARCESCGTECLIKDAVKALNVKGNVQVGNATINIYGTNTESLLQRVEIMLADGNFRGAREKCDALLDMDPTEGRIYLFMLMADLRCRSRNDLAKQQRLFNDNIYYKKAVQFGNAAIKEELNDYLKRIQFDRQKGEYIFFGTVNGRQLWWTVLDRVEQKALIIINGVICNRPFHQFGCNISWKDCSLRSWLNNDFLELCFSEEEQSRILLCDNVINEDNPEYKTKGCEPTSDKVFLLSVSEAKNYYSDNQSRANGSWWWLRTPGDSPNYAAFVRYDGKIHDYGLLVDSQDIGVRPAMWIKVD
jgi:hypothetical protein